MPTNDSISDASICDTKIADMSFSFDEIEELINDATKKQAEFSEDSSAVSKILSNEEYKASEDTAAKFFAPLEGCCVEALRY